MPLTGRFGAIEKAPLAPIATRLGKPPSTCSCSEATPDRLSVTNPVMVGDWLVTRPEVWLNWIFGAIVSFARSNEFSVCAAT